MAFEPWTSSSGLLVLWVLSSIVFFYAPSVLWMQPRASSPFVELYYSTASAVLSQDPASVADGDASPVTLAQLVKRKVRAFSPEAGFNGVWWLPSGHAQTIYCSVGDFSKVDPIAYERKLLQLIDGGIIAIDVTPPLADQPAHSGERVLLVAHGLTGGSHESYVRAALTRLTASEKSGGLGFRAVVVNYRGCNGCPVRTPKLYHAGSSDDIRPVALWVCRTFPDCSMYGIGFSLGANIMTKYAGEEGEDCPLSGMVVLANVWDFVKGSHHIERGTLANRLLYQNVLGGALRALLQLHQDVFLSAPSPPLSRELLARIFRKWIVSLREYDEMVTAPLYGFKDAADYYYSISSSRFVERIRIPCLAINSLDDPIVGKSNLPLSQVSRSPWVVLAATRSGGHMGWFARSDTGERGVLERWYVRPLEQFFAALLEHGLRKRPVPEIDIDGEGFLRQRGRPAVEFIEIVPGAADTVVSGTKESRLFSGW
ncbi:hypothetical protein A0H81_13256 [Grifola frondosa]|uniref:AB hydrolase-1 domain-containing protein n=1 Tax=Grifola frondosa TaxID=5627 RepID=A0A1C7LQG5_GRIFR|nr:hypothetical protein A0H81_13256 [Grifola frondosa]